MESSNCDYSLVSNLQKYYNDEEILILKRLTSSVNTQPYEICVTLELLHLDNKMHSIKTCMWSILEMKQDVL